MSICFVKNLDILNMEYITFVSNYYKNAFVEHFLREHYTLKKYRYLEKQVLQYKIYK